MGQRLRGGLAAERPDASAGTDALTGALLGAGTGALSGGTEWVMGLLQGGQELRDAGTAPTADVAGIDRACALGGNG